MKRSTFTLLSLFLFVNANTAQAHPHNDVEQQALISIGWDSLALEIRIVPSLDEGAAIYAHIDSNGDGLVSDSEAAVFGAQVLSKARLEVGGDEISLGNPNVLIPNKESVSAGLAVIKIDADASFPPITNARHTVAFEITYEEFSQDWFIQPFFYAPLMEQPTKPSVHRSASGHRVEIKLSP
ncbi:MAG: hypothetical protein ACR2PR_03685 [Pseudohongiellaceae bacterium]